MILLRHQISTLWQRIMQALHNEQLVADHRWCMKLMEREAPALSWSASQTMSTDLQQVR